MRTLTTAALLLSVALGVGCQARRSDRDRFAESGVAQAVNARPPADCYTIVYTPDTTAYGFPHVVALMSGRDSARALWIPEPRDTLEAWRMFQVGGYWRRFAGDSLRVLFTNGTSTVVLAVVRGPQGIQGSAAWLSGRADTLPPPRAGAEGQRVDCATLRGR